jgi:signal transduction histidine kinase
MIIGNKLLLFAIALPLVTLLVIGIQTFESIVSFQQQTKFIEETHQLILSLQNLLTLIIDAETGQRGFIITGDDKYLEPYELSLSSLNSTISRIDNLVNKEKHSDQLQNINSNVYLLIQDKILELENTIDARKNNGFNASAESISTDSGKRIMDQIRNNIISIIQEEEKILQSNSNKSVVDGQNLLFTYIIGIIVSIGITIVTIIFTYLQLNIKHRQMTKLLEIEIDKKTKELQQSNVFLKKLNDDLKKHDDMQKEFINVAAHELRTPIQSIVGYLQMLKSFPENFKKYLEPLERNSQRLYRLTEDILDIAKIESDTLKLNKEKFDLYKLVKETINEFVNNNDERNEKKNEFQIIYQNENNQKEFYDDRNKSLYVYADKNRLQQVISNLLTNACKFTEKGKIIVKITNNEDFVYLFVHDNGQGLDPKILPRLFEKFTTKSEFGGTGLGLYISKNIVKEHGGKIWGKNNDDGIGAEFGFTLPLY